VPQNVEPHITVKSQGGLGEDRAWLPRVEAAVKNFDKFRISFDGIGSFREDVVFLKPAFSQGLINLHKVLLDAVGPYEDLAGKYFENDRYSPHLTLGGIKWGLNKGELVLMMERAQDELRNLPDFEINSMRIYQKNIGDRSWEKLLDVFFNQ
jgi:2'-5' RNA ligase